MRTAIPRPRLTERQQRLMQRLGEGGTNDNIAADLGVSRCSIEQRIARLRLRIGARDTRHLLVLGCAWGFIDAQAAIAPPPAAAE